MLTLLRACRRVGCDSAPGASGYCVKHNPLSARSFVDKAPRRARPVTGAVPDEYVYAVLDGTLVKVGRTIAPERYQRPGAAVRSGGRKRWRLIVAELADYRCPDGRFVAHPAVFAVFPELA